MVTTHEMTAFHWRDALPGGVAARVHARASLAALVLLLGVLLLLALANVTPAGQMRLFGHDLPVVCLWQRWYDTPCLSCGLTRGVTLLLHGRVAAAVAAHPGAGCVAIWLLLQVLARPLIAWRATRLPPDALLADLLLSAGTLALAIVVPGWVG